VIDWQMVGALGFWVSVGVGIVVIVAEMFAAGRSRDDGEFVMEKPEFADTEPEPSPAEVVVVARVRRTRAERPELLRVGPYVDHPIDDFTEPLRSWEKPKKGVTYTSHNGWDPE